MKFYHISTKSDIEEFIPKIPSSIVDYENNDIERICISKTIDDCLTGSPIVLENNIGQTLYLYEFNITNMDYLIYPGELICEKLVPDAVLTREHWYLKPLIPVNKFQLTINDLSDARQYVIFITHDKIPIAFYRDDAIQQGLFENFKGISIHEHERWIFHQIDYTLKEFK